MKDSFQARSTLSVGGKTYSIARLGALAEKGFDLERLPYSLRVLLENLLRREDGVTVPKGDVEALAGWKAVDGRRPEIAFMPARVLLQDFTGVPAVVDLAAMRDAMVRLGGDPRKINPLQPVELVIDHSVQVDEFGRPDAARMNTEKEFARNGERYVFLRWGQTAFEGFRVVPPGTGIVHQVNLECLARGVMVSEVDGETWAYPDTLVGTDSHTTMINGLGVLGWGVGGIEAEAAMLGQPVSMLIPDVVGVRLSGSLPEGTTATDLVLAITERLRKHGVVGKFVEFFGSGMKHLPLADRATLANMAPEYGATCGIFPMDAETLRYLELSGRSKETVALVEAYMREQGLFYEDGTPDAEYTVVIDFDLGTVEPSLAGPSRPQDRVALKDMKASFEKAAAMFDARRNGGSGDGGGTAVASRRETEVRIGGETVTLHDGSVVIAAITSCTNTSNPSVMLAAGLVAKKAAALGLRTKPWVKTSLAPGSKVVTRYLEKSGLLAALEEQRFHVVGYGCTTCIGNSGPLPEPVAKGVTEADLTVASVLSGNRNFEGRVHAQVRASYLASPPLVVAYALAGRVDFDPMTEPLGQGADGPVYLKDVWPSSTEVADAVRAVSSDLFTAEYQDVFAGDPEWRSLDTPEGATYAWDASSTYVQEPPYFEGMTLEVPEVRPIAGARVLALFGDTITTDHISPAGGIKTDSPAGRYLQDQRIAPADFNSYGARRGNHHVMMRGTFANIRIRNGLVPGVEGGFTVHHPTGEQMSIYDAAMKYKEEGTPLCVLAGKEYGTGSSRDWAAKGPFLQGVRFVIAESYERIHRSNLVGMGILPLEFPKGESAAGLGLDGTETIDVQGLTELLAADKTAGKTVHVVAKRDGGATVEFDAPVRIDTPQEVEYYKNGGILQYVLRRLAER
jgi:aconitate hydratase